MSSVYVLRPFGAGAQGYVVKYAGPAELLGSVHAVMDGQRCISPDVSGQLIDSMQRSITAAPHRALSPRQLEVLRLVAQGLTTKVIERPGLERAHWRVASLSDQSTARAARRRWHGVLRHPARLGAVRRLNFGWQKCVRCPSNFAFQRAGLTPPWTAEQQAG